VRPVIRMAQTTWCACHVAAFEFFGGGVPVRLVCDNLRTGVDKPDLYGPQINRSYAALAAHLWHPDRPAAGAQTPGRGLGFKVHLCGGLGGNSFSERAALSGGEARVTGDWWFVETCILVVSLRELRIPALVQLLRWCGALRGVARVRFW
jgi:hypothetical protein